MAKAAANSDTIIQRFDSTSYQLEEKIGEGGFGCVYRARQINTGQTVAIKFLAMSHDLDEAKRQRYVDRFERETQLSCYLQHPNIVRLLDKGVCDNYLFYAVFEHVDGKSLKEVLLDDGALSPVETVEVMGQVLEALSHAHEQGIIHRDIKPANIMLLRTDTRTYAKVLDFGIGTFTSEARQQDYKTLTLTQEALGTPSYSAPEQLRGEPPTVKTDIYVWALVFIECLTGSPTITGSTVASIFHKQLSPSNVPLPLGLSGHPVSALLRRALQKKVHDRTITAQALYRELHQLNLSNLVGNLAENSYQASNSDRAMLQTAINQNTKTETLLTERKQITAVAVCLQACKVSDEILDSEVIDALHRDQKNQCIDIAIRYGAYHVGSLGDTLLFYFGYPAVSENDARLAARAVLDITGGLVKRNALLKLTQNLTLHAKVGVHTGDEDDLRLWQKYGVEPKSQALFLMGHIQAFIGQFECAIESCNQSEIWARKSGCSMSVDGATTFKAISYYHQQDPIGVSGVTGEYAAKVKGVREPEWLEGYIVSLDDWANNEHDFAYRFIMGLWQSESYCAVSFWLPMLCQVLVDEDPSFVATLAGDAIQKCTAMKQVAAVPLLHRCLAVAKCKLSGDADSIADDHFRQGYQLAMGLKAYGIALDIVVFWLEHSKTMADEPEAMESLALTLSYFSTDSKAPVLRHAKSLLR